METRKVMLPIIICAFALMLSINLAQAAPATGATLYTADASGNMQVEFGSGETVYIHWKANGEVNIEARFESGGAIDGQWLNPSEGVVIEYIPSKGSGVYYIICTGSPVWPIAVGTIFVVPEVPLGTVMAMVASLSAFGVFGAVKLKQAKVKRIQA